MAVWRHCVLGIAGVGVRYRELGPVISHVAASHSCSVVKVPAMFGIGQTSLTAISSATTQHPHAAHPSTCCNIHPHAYTSVHTYLCMHACMRVHSHACTRVHTHLDTRQHGNGTGCTIPFATTAHGVGGSQWHLQSYCGHGIGRLFHTAPNVPHYAKNKAVGIMRPERGTGLAMAPNMFWASSSHG